jgi:hypothetical protein
MSKQVFYTLLWRAAYITTAMIGIWFCLNTVLDGSIWNGMTPSKSALTVEYCEFNNTEKLFHQSMNTYSNLAYFFFGILIVLLAFEDYKNKGMQGLNRMAQFPLLSAFMGVCFIYLSFGSAFFHASLTWVGQRVDMNGTYGLSVALLGIGLYQVLQKINFTEKIKRYWIGALGVLLLAFLKIHLMVSSSILLPILILTNLALSITNYIQFRKERSLIFPILSLVLLVIAVKIRTLDVQKVDCDPYSWYQGHAVWHLLTAMSSFCSYAFYRFTPLSISSNL